MTSTDGDPTRTFYDRISKAYDLIASASEQEARQKGLDILAVAPGERVLEIGYGTGHSLVALAEAVGAEGAVCGIDLSEGMREVARERLAGSGLAGRVELDVGDARALPYGDGRFDAVAMSFTLELFDPEEDLPRVLAEVRRVLEPGGRLGVVGLETRDGSNAIVDFYRWFHRHFPHIVDCQPIRLVSLLEAAGFRVGERIATSIWGLPVAAVVARRDG